MTEISSYVPGTPNWVDVSSPNADEAAAFYRELFGWEVTDAEPEGHDAGGYRMFQLRGHLVAGIGPVQDGGSPAMWRTYIATADAAATADAVRAAGGTVIMDPFPIFDAGRVLTATDPAGATFSAWEADRHIGAGLVNEPDTFSWTELNTRDPDIAVAFYTEVFGWEPRTVTTDTGTVHTELLVDGRAVAGAVDMRGRVPEEIPAHWLVHFAVDDPDASVARVEELGGDVMVPPVDVEAGRYSVVSDPAGAFFALVARR